VCLDRGAISGWSWADAQAHDRRAFIRGALLGAASLSLGRSGPHVEWVYASRRRAAELRSRLAECEINAAVSLRRQRTVVYVKGQEEVATLLRLTGANRALLDFETGRVGRDVRNRLNRLLNAEGANLDRTVRAADRQLRAIGMLRDAGRLDGLPDGLRQAALQRRARPDADLDTLAEALGVSRSATNHRLRRLVELADELSDVATA
jgi:DNA-binding protein WhiA